ncbi:hypothetical protein ABPG74_013050 [Tetrahymena malaccensis]
MSTAGNCKNPCFSKNNNLLPGAVIGFPAYLFMFKNLWIPLHINQNDYLNLCCDQQRTFDFLDGLIVPDFVDIRQTNLDDFNDIKVNITQDELSNQFNYQINHHIQRVALQASQNSLQASANMTTLLQGIDPECKNDQHFWYDLFKQLGKSFVASVYLGTEIKMSFYFQSSQQYTQEEIKETYWNYIQNNPIGTFKGFQGGYCSGCFIKFDETSYKDLLDDLSIYGYSWIIPVEEFNIQNSLTVIDSYNLFNQESPIIQQCVKKNWDIFNSIYQQNK